MADVQLLDVTVNQNLRGLERRGRTDIYNRKIFPQFDRDLLFNRTGRE